MIFTDNLDDNNTFISYDNNTLKDTEISISSWASSLGLEHTKVIFHFIHFDAIEYTLLLTFLKFGYTQELALKHKTFH